MSATCRPGLLRALWRLAAGALVSMAAAAQPAATFVIDLRTQIAAGQFDPVRDQVGVRGALPPLSWGQTMLAGAQGDGRYLLRVPIAVPSSRRQPLAYKFKIERPEQPQEGWEPGGNHLLPLGQAEARIERAFGSEPAPPALQRTGRIDRYPAFASRHLGVREVQVWLPPGYGQAHRRRYPVLYLHDGQNMFDAAAAGAEWQIDETAQRLVAAGAVAPMIVVAVSSTASRIDDYTPVAMQREGRSAGGGLALHARFLLEELRPFVDGRYRTRRGARHTAVGGSSLGALASLWLLSHHPQHFGAGLLVSPALWWADAQILHEVETRPPPQPRPRLWLDIGAHEGDEALQGARRLRDALLARGWRHAATPATPAAADLAYVEDPDGTHDEAAWATRVEAMLRFLYPLPAAR